MILRTALIFMLGTASALGAQQAATVADGAVLRVLDKSSGRVSDLELQNGARSEAGLLAVTLKECRIPDRNPTGEAFAHVLIEDSRRPDPVFDGWMLASSPALNALDHARYDVWVLRCITS